MKTKHLLAACTALCAFTLLPARIHANAIAYSVTVLDGLGGSFGSSADSINASGQVAGSSYILDNTVTHAVRWTGTTTTDLGSVVPFGGIYGSDAVGINASGQVAGSYKTANGGATYGGLWSGATPATLNGIGSLNVNIYASGNAINTSGQVAGVSMMTTNGGVSNFYRAVLWTGATPTNLGTLGGIYSYNSYGYGINDSGQVAGYSTGDGTSHAVRWTGTTPTDLGTLGGGVSEAFGINVTGQVAGGAQTTGNAFHAVRWTGTAAEDLGTLGGSTSEGFGINASGDVVGISNIAGNAASHAFLYTGGTMYDLFTLLLLGSGVSDLSINSAGTINDSGQIAATGTINGQRHALRLDPVAAPEPSSALLLIGSAGLFLLRRRRI